jgi:hypothetical protein
MIRTLFGGICDDSIDCIRWLYLRQQIADRNAAARRNLDAIMKRREGEE